MSNTYKIVRHYRDTNKQNRAIAKGLSLEEARLHCTQEDTHKTDKTGKIIWFDGFIKER